MMVILWNNCYSIKTVNKELWGHCYRAVINFSSSFVYRSLCACISPVLVTTWHTWN